MQFTALLQYVYSSKINNLYTFRASCFFNLANRFVSISMRLYLKSHQLPANLLNKIVSLCIDMFGVRVVCGRWYLYVVLSILIWLYGLNYGFCMWCCMWCCLWCFMLYLYVLLYVCAVVGLYGVCMCCCIWCCIWSFMWYPFVVYVCGAVYGVLCGTCMWCCI